MLEQLGLFQSNDNLMDNTGKICRFCLFEGREYKDRPLIHLFETFKYEDIVEKIQNCLNIKLSPNDQIPPIICQSCVEKVNCFSDFIELYSKSEKQLKRLYGLDQKFSDTSQASDLAPSVNWISDERIRSACRSESDISVSYKSLPKQDGQHFKTPGRQFLTINQRKSNLMLMIQKRKPKEKEEPSCLKNSFHFKCKICKKKFSSIYEYQHHAKADHDKETIYKCEKCDKIFMDKKTYLEHEKNHKVPCKICNVQVVAKNMGLHLHKHAEKFRTKPSAMTSKKSHKIPTCRICRKTFKSEKGLAVHAKKNHETRKIRFSANKKHRADQLKFKIRLKQLMKAKSYKCKFCSVQFSALKKLQEHNMHSHSNTKKKCPKCSKEFFSKKHLNKHILRCFDASSSLTVNRSSSLPTIK